MHAGHRPQPLNPAMADVPVMRALFIRQPYAELILRGLKRIEYRSRPTKIIGERLYIYAARTWGGWAGVNGHGTDDVKEGEALTGVIVGTAIISHVTNGGSGGAAYECIFPT